MFVQCESDKVMRYFDDFSLMKKKVGLNLTKIIKKRLDQLKAARTFSVFLSTGLGKPHRLRENLDGYYGVNLSANVRLVIKPEAKSLDPSELVQCDTVIMKGVEDYHGKKQEWIIP